MCSAPLIKRWFEAYQRVRINPFWDKPDLGLLDLSAIHPANQMKTIHSAPYRHLLSLLIEARKAAHLTQQELSQKLGRPQSYVSKFERGERRLDVIEFLEVTRNINADPHRLLIEIEPLLVKESMDSSMSERYPQKSTLQTVGHRLLIR